MQHIPVYLENNMQICSSLEKITNISIVGSFVFGFQRKEDVGEYTIIVTGLIYAYFLCPYAKCLEKTMKRNLQKSSMYH